MEVMNKFKKEARIRNLCSNFALLWGQCKTKEDYVRLSLMPQSIPYIATSSYDGWGISTEDIYANFSSVINGKRVYKNIDGIENTKGVLYVKYNNKTKRIKENIVHIMDSTNSTFIVEKTQCPMIYISNNSNVKIEANGYNTISLYLFDNCLVDITNIKPDTKVLITKYSDNGKLITNNNVSNITYFKKPIEI